MKKLWITLAIAALCLAGCKTTKPEKDTDDGYRPWWADTKVEAPAQK